MSIKLKIRYLIVSKTHNEYCLESAKIKEDSQQYTEYITPNPEWVKKYIADNDSVNKNICGWDKDLIKKEVGLDGNEFYEPTTIHIPISAELIKNGLRDEFLSSIKEDILKNKVQTNNYNKKGEFIILNRRPTNLGPVSFIN